jgi:hypothetical protein
VDNRLDTSHRLPDERPIFHAADHVCRNAADPV